MKYYGILIALFLVVGCKDAVQLEDLDHLQGYWEIEKVVLPDGSSKTYSINTTIDYISYKELSGYRKKVQPRLDGTFNTSDDAEFFRIVPKNNTFIVQYTNKLSQWEEKIISVSTEELIVQNQEKITYYYKRFEEIIPE